MKKLLEWITLWQMVWIVMMAIGTLTFIFIRPEVLLIILVVAGYFIFISNTDK